MSDYGHPITFAGATSTPDRWPELPWRDWEPTMSTLHMWVQIVGKVRMALAPPLNHWWHVPLYVTARGLTTSPIPYGGRDVPGRLRLRRPPTHGHRERRRRLHDALEPRSVARFYREFMAGLREPRDRRADLAASGRGRRRRSRSTQDERHASYDPGTAHAVLARTRPGGPRDEDVPERLRRQGQPGPLLLGRLRPGRPRGTRAGRRRSIPAASPTARTG